MGLISDTYKCEFTSDYLMINGEFVQYINGKSIPYNKQVYIKKNDILRIGIGKTFSKEAIEHILLICFLLIPIRFVLQQIGKFFITLFNGSYGFFDFIGNLLMSNILFLGLLISAFTMYLMSFKKVLEINTLVGIFSLSIKNISQEDISNFQREFYTIAD